MNRPMTPAEARRNYWRDVAAVAAYGRRLIGESTKDQRISRMKRMARRNGAR